MGGIGASKLDVVFHRVSKEIDLLKYHGDLIHQALQGIVLHILTAHQDGATLHIPEPGDEITQCGFPEPLGPTMAVVVLSGMVKDTSRRMGRWS